jgi:TonB family protein
MNASLLTILRVAALLPACAVLPVAFATASDSSADPAAPAFDQPPHVRYSVMPVLPDKLADADGLVELVVNIKSCTNPALVDPVISSMWRWRYAPAERAGKAVASTFVQPIEFSATGVISAVEHKPASTPARAVGRVAPTLSAALKHVSGQTIVAVNLDARGNVTDAAIVLSSQEELNAPSFDAVRQWKFSPRIEGGHAVPTKLQVPFRYVGEPMTAADEAEALAANNHAPQAVRVSNLELPESLAKTSGEAEIEFMVDRDGYVSAPAVKSATNPEFAEIARQSVLAWKFQPAVKDGHAVAARVIQPFRFNDRLVTTDSKEAVDRLPVPDATVQPKVPAELRHVPGRVVVKFAIDASGNVTDVTVVEATLAEFAGPALEAAKQWKFQAAVKSGRPTPATVAVPFLFGT